MSISRFSIGTITLSFALAMSFTLLSGCSPSTSPETERNSSNEPTVTPVSTINQVCPIMGGEVSPDGGSTEFNGQTVGFCCPECIDEFNALSDEEKTAALAKAAESAHDESEHAGHGE